MTTLAATPGANAPAPRWVRDAAGAALTMAAVLLAFAITCALRAALGFSAQEVVLAVALTLMLGRVLGRSHRAGQAGARWLVVVEVPVLGLAAAGAGWLVVHQPWVGQPLLVVALSVGLVTRRWDGVVREAGRLVALPFLALLVTPAPVVRAGHASSGSVWWSPLIGLVAVGCAGGAAAARARWLPTGEPTGAPGPSHRPARRASRRLDAPTRMALQMLVGLGVALVVGHLLLGHRWPWVVLSAYIVASGNRGRGDVAHKAALRLVGAGVGTVGASLAASALPVGNRWLVVALFAVMAVALALRERSYAFWACGVTAVVALLHGYYGDVGTSALTERAVGVVVGCAIGLAAAWFVVPVRTADVLRRRIADCLAALTDDLDPAASGPSALPGALRGLDEIAPALRAHHRTLGRRPGRPAGVPPVHAVHAIAALHRIAHLPTDEPARRRLRRDVVRVRRAMAGRDDVSADELPADLAAVHAVLHATARRR